MKPNSAETCCRLGDASPRFRGRIVSVTGALSDSSLPSDELERRLVEMGFVEGASVELRHQGLFRADPIAVQVDGTLVALRRREAQAILVSAGD
ncbi:MAG TPA: FeoA family protein [Acetobacteraceae bacterium]|nr:FeoA family protein [Acetobacteraceae bacterium]